MVAVPTDIGPGTLLYRADILAKAGVGEAELTASWDSYVAAGAKIKAATGAYLMAHARDMKDMVIRIGIQPGEGLYFDQQSNVLVSSPRFVRAFELARQVRRQKLDARVAAWSNEWSEGFKRGSIATQLTGAWLAGHLNNWLAPDTKGLWRAAQLPEGAFAAYGGTFLAIPRGAPAANKPLAWEFIQLLTLHREQQLAAFKSQDAFPALLQTSTTRSSSSRSSSSAARRRGSAGARPRPGSPPSACTSRTPLPRKSSTPNSTRCSIAARTSRGPG